jgi:cytochrome c-type biogenesis protein CcmH/NrfF
MVSAGRTEDEIVAFYVARYGQRILREPQGSSAIWLRVVPLVVGAVGLLLVASYIVHAHRRKPQVISPSGPVPDDEEWL